MKGHRRKIDPDLRRALWEAQNRRCGYCGTKIGFFEVTVDHIIPLSRGGPDCMDNMICSCKPCNESQKSENISSVIPFLVIASNESPILPYSSETLSGIFAELFKNSSANFFTLVKLLITSNLIHHT